MVLDKYFVQKPGPFLDHNGPLLRHIQPAKLRVHMALHKHIVASDTRIEALSIEHCVSVLYPIHNIAHVNGVWHKGVVNLWV